MKSWRENPFSEAEPDRRAIWDMLVSIGEWAEFNEVYSRHFHSPYPTRTAVQAVLWNGIKVEIDVLSLDLVRLTF